VRAREDGGRRLASELVEGERGIGEREQPSRAALDVVAGQRPVLVERGTVATVVGVEREWEVVAVRELPRQERERAQAEPVQGGVELRRAHAHAPVYALAGGSPPRSRR
jgi:hypothetical protein